MTGTGATRFTLDMARLALLVLVLICYWPGLGGGFVFDDFPNIVSNTALHIVPGKDPDWLGAAMSSPARNLPRPMAMLSFAINHYYTGLDPLPMKATNLAIHILNALLVFGLVRCLLRFRLDGEPSVTRADWVALAVAAFWSLHPINLMAVLFVVQRMESLSHVFVFAGLWVYATVRTRQPRDGQAGAWRLAATLVAFTALGVLAKESAALLPLYAFLLEACLFRFRTRPDGDSDRSLIWMFVPVLWLPAIVGASWLTWGALDPAAFAGRSFTLGERLLTEPRVLMDYVRWTLVPDLGQLSLYHDDLRVSHGLLDPASTLLSLLGLSALAGCAWLSRRRWPLVSLGLTWFLAAHALTATVLPLELVFEHRNYFASLGLCLVSAELLLALGRGRWRSSAVALALLAALLLGALTTLRASEWRNPMSFAVAEVAKHPGSPRATYYVGWMLANASEYRPESPLLDEAFAALERARALPDASVLPDQAALVLAARTGRPLDPRWWRSLQARLRHDPVGPQETGALAAMVACAIARQCAFPPEEMLATFGAALARGGHPEVLNNYGNYALNVLHDPELAVRAWTESCELNSSEPQYRISLVKLQIVLGRDAEARSGIAILRALGRLGQYEREARDLEQRLHARKG
jgi:hypothetical protein